MKDFEDVMLDIGWKSIEREYTRFKDIDTKAIGIITISGILIAFIKLPTDTDIISSVLLMATIFSFLITVWFSIKTIRVRGFKVVSANNIIEDLKNLPPKPRMQGVVNTLADAELEINTVCLSKARELDDAIYSLGISVMILMVYILQSSHFITSIIKFILSLLFSQELHI